MTSSLLQDLAVVLLISGVTALVSHRLHQPKLVAYVLAGLIIGPHTPPFSLIRDEETIRTLADIGIVFLMFSLGLDFNLRKLRRVGATAVLTAILDVGVMVWLGYLLGRWMGWPPIASLLLGAIICDSSTTILARILHDLDRKKERFSDLAVGISIVEDVLAVVMIAVLTGLALTGSVQAGLVATSVWQLVLFIVLVTVIGLLTVPRTLDYLLRLGSDELLLVAVVGLCFGVSLLAVKMGLSLALGAVLVGAVAAESRALPKVEALVAPLRHVFSAVFFVTIGLRLDPSAIWHHLPVIAGVTAVVIAGKFTCNTAGVLLTGHSLDTAFMVGAGMAQIGEFAFIIAALALTLGVGADSVYPIGVATAVISTVLSPYLIRGADLAVARLDGTARWHRWVAATRFYSRWTESIGRRSSTGAIRKIIRRSIAIIAINVVLISAVFGIAAYVARTMGARGGEWIGRPSLFAAILWLGAAAISLPLYVVTVRKIEALGMLLAESALPLNLKGGWPRHVRTFLAHAITLFGVGALVLLTVILSSALLPSREILILLAVVAVAGAIWARRRLSQVYSHAETALHAVFSPSPSESGPLVSAPVADAIEMEPYVIPSLPHGGGELTLRSISLRARSGATVVAFERGGERYTNPDPDMPLRVGDRLLILGTTEQIASARLVMQSNGQKRGGDRERMSPPPHFRGTSEG